MINCQMLPALRFDLAERIKERVRLGVVFDTRIRSNVRQWKNLERMLILAGNDAAGFVGYVSARE